MKFIFDHNLPPSLARGLAEFSKSNSDVEVVVPLKDRFNPATTPDVVWLKALADEGDWVVISIDRFRKSSAEREMLRKQGLTVFVLDPQWSTTYWLQAARLVQWWPKIIDVARLTSKSAHRVPWRFTNKSTFEQIRV